MPEVQEKFDDEAAAIARAKELAKEYDNYGAVVIESNGTFYVEVNCQVLVRSWEREVWNSES